MKNNQTEHVVNKQEDEDVAVYILHGAKAIKNKKQNKPQQVTYGSAESIKFRVSDKLVKSLTVLYRP